MRLTQDDVDLDAGMLHIRHTKFDKSRVVPLAPDLVQQLAAMPDAGITEHFGAAFPKSRSFPAHAGDGIRLPPCARLSTSTENRRH